MSHTLPADPSSHLLLGAQQRHEVAAQHDADDGGLALARLPNDWEAAVGAAPQRGHNAGHPLHPLEGGGGLSARLPVVAQQGQALEVEAWQ